MESPYALKRILRSCQHDTAIEVILNEVKDLSSILRIAFV